MIRMFNVGSKINFVDNENAFVGFDCDMGGTMAFRMRDEYDFTDKGWLILYNCHNGFYSHGWEFGRLNVEKEGRI